MDIEAVRRGAAGVGYYGGRRGCLFALLPQPADADACLEAAGFTVFGDSDDKWDEDFDALISALLNALVHRFGAPTVVAPRGSRQPTWIDRLRHLGRMGRFLAGTSASAAEGLNPERLSPAQALGRAAADDNYLDFGAVEFSDAVAFCADGHPILWVWLADSTKGEWPGIAEAASGSWPSADLSIAWDELVPRRPVSLGNHPPPQHKSERLPMRPS